MLLLLFVVSFDVHGSSDIHCSIAEAMFGLVWLQVRARIGNWPDLAPIGQQWVWSRVWQGLPKLTRVELRREMGGHWR